MKAILVILFIFIVCYLTNYVFLKENTVYSIDGACVTLIKKNLFIVLIGYMDKPPVKISTIEFIIKLYC